MTRLSVWGFELPAADAGRYNQVVVALYLSSLIVAEAIGTWFVARAALEWADVRRSLRLARLDWGATFLVPAVIFAVPIVQFMDLDTAGRSVIGSVMALGVFLTFLPKVLGIFPGVIRACRSLKSLLPEAAAPGWGTALVAPIAALFFLLAFFLLAFFIGVHAQAGLPLALTLALWTAAPLVYIRVAERLTQALPETEGRALVGALRNKSKLFVIAGGVCFVWQFFRWIDLGDISVSDLSALVSGTVGSMLLLTVVTADFFLGLLREAFLRQRRIQGTGLNRTSSVS